MSSADPVGSHPFDLALRLVPAGAGACPEALRWRGHTSAAYANMVGPYGGITAAQALQAVMVHPARLGDPVAFSGNFAAALEDGEFTIAATPVRTNRSTQHWTVATTQRQADGAERVLFTATVMTAVRRATWSAADAAMPAAPPPLSIARRHGAARVAWRERYDWRQVSGPMPEAWDGTENRESTSRVWIRDEPPRPLDFPSLTALCDFFYPRIWLRRARRVAIGTVTMTVYYHADTRRLAAVTDRHVLGEARGHNFIDGYFDQAAMLWAPDGAPLATTHQLVYYRE